MLPCGTQNTQIHPHCEFLFVQHSDSSAYTSSANLYIVI